MRSRQWLSIGFLVVFLLACSINFTSVALFVSVLATPSISTPTPHIPRPTPTATSQPIAASVSTVVIAYYQALQKKDYNQAFTFFAENSTITSQSGSQPISKDILKQIDTQKGTIDKFSPNMVYLPSQDAVSVVQVVVKRHDHSAYTVNITLDLETEGWKITDIDGL